MNSAANHLSQIITSSLQTNTEYVFPIPVFQGSLLEHYTVSIRRSSTFQTTQDYAAMDYVLVCELTRDPQSRLPVVYSSSPFQLFSVVQGFLDRDRYSTNERGELCDNPNIVRLARTAFGLACPES
jgi:hypothetical protein